MEWNKVDLDTERGQELKRQLEKAERESGIPLIPPVKRPPWRPIQVERARANKIASDAKHGIVPSTIPKPKTKKKKQVPQQPRKKRGVNSSRG
jgi:hypothetical protein